MESTVTLLGKGLFLNSFADASELVKDIESCKNLKIFCLTGNSLGIDSALAVSLALEKKPTLKEALLSDIFTGRKQHEIPYALKFISSGIMISGAFLSKLDVSDNALGPVGIQGLLPFFRHCFSLESLNLKNVGLGVDGSVMVCSALLEAIDRSLILGRQLCLKVLICGQNRLENDGALQFSKVVAKLPALENLDLSQNSIELDGIKHVTVALQNTKRLQILDLFDNVLKENGAMQISEALPYLKNLKKLNVGDCLLRHGSIILSKRMFQYCPEIESFDISYNEIKKHDILQILKVIRKMQNLPNVIISGNELNRNEYKFLRQIAHNWEMSNYVTLESEESDIDDEEADGDEKGSVDGGDDFADSQYIEIIDRGNAEDYRKDLLATTADFSQNIKQKVMLLCDRPDFLLRDVQSICYELLRDVVFELQENEIFYEYSEVKKYPDNADEKNVFIMVQNLQFAYLTNALRSVIRDRCGHSESFFATDCHKLLCILKYETARQALEVKKCMDGLRWPLSNSRKLKVSIISAEEGKDMVDKLASTYESQMKKARYQRVVRKVL